MTSRGRALMLGGTAAGTLLLAAVAWYPRAPSRPETETEARATEARTRQRDFTPTAGEAARTALADAEARARARETPTKLAPAPQAPREIPVGPSGPRPPERTMTGWIADYRNAVCACKTRSCVGNIQSEFLDALGNTKYVADRDQDGYVEASRQAIRCYASLPEDS